MNDEPGDTTLSIGNASVTIPGERRRFRVDTAILTARGRHRVRLTFAGPEGSVSIDLPRVVFWRMTSLFHEQSIAADAGTKPPEPGQRKRP